MFVLVVFMLLAPAFTWAQTDDFVSLMPKADLSEFWSAAASPEGTWSLENGVIAAKGKPMGILRSNKKYKNFVLRVELRFKKEGWTKAPAEWPNAGVFIFASEEVRERYPHWPRSFVEVQGHYGEIASALYQLQKGKWRRLIAEHITTVEELCPKIASRTLFCGRFSPHVAQQIEEHLGKRAVVLKGTIRRAGFLAELGWRRLKKGDVDHPTTLQPLYLRRPAITTPKRENG